MNIGVNIIKLIDILIVVMSLSFINKICFKYIIITIIAIQ